LKLGTGNSATSTARAIAHGFARRYHELPMKRKLGLFVYTEERNCPLCGSEHVHRTKRGRILEFWVLLFLPYRPYRCGKCRQRFYGPKNLPKREIDHELDAP
jgi:ribosomal protein L37AE/L43A